MKQPSDYDPVHRRLSSAVVKPLLRIRDGLDSKTEAFFTGIYEDLYLVQPGDLVVGMDGDFNCALWRGPEAVLNQRVCKVSPDERLYCKQFLSYALSGYLRAINGATSSVTVKHLSSRTVQEIPLPLPPRAEQDKIVALTAPVLGDPTTRIYGSKLVGMLIIHSNIARVRRHRDNNHPPPGQTPAAQEEVPYNESCRADAEHAPPSRPRWPRVQG